MNAAPIKARYPRKLALSVASEIVNALGPFTEQLVVAGSLRRRKLEVGDVEILYIPKFEATLAMKQADLLAPVPQTLVNSADSQLDRMLAGGVLRKRTNSLGSEIWGEKNKLARHTASGMPVDFFSCSKSGWFSYLVCRTGGSQTNIRIASALKAKGWQWGIYDGVWDQEGHLMQVFSEQHLFELAGLPYLEPWQRE